MRVVPPRAALNLAAVASDEGSATGQAPSVTRRSEAGRHNDSKQLIDPPGEGDADGWDDQNARHDSADASPSSTKLTSRNTNPDGENSHRHEGCPHTGNGRGSERELDLESDRCDGADRSQSSQHPAKP
jgi:hypothetical protein